nr:aminopeptidase N-like [Leptinotarsa decemlineata]XP_023018018.1 aminopeptidase N-like [Leptinotarsa decemlineata]XP_023018019.1 aminopeptidase N-like [Leptinotarsa decemlineata]XP_023018020.1 aminopeptidase N-like [Leptinotarsa decemlineata]
MRIIKIISPMLLLLQIVDAQSQYRLPQTIKPKHYKLELEVDPEQPNFNGRVTIILDVVKEDTKELQLHAPSKAINISRITLGQDDICNFVPSNNITDIIQISCPKILTTGTPIIFEYVGKFTIDGMYGFYKSTYDKQVLVATQFQPVHARSAFPCFDEPTFKARFDITIIHPSTFNVLANTPAKNTTKIDGNKIITTFQTTPMMSTYLVAFIVSHFEPALVSKGKYNVYARKSAEANMEIAKNYGEKLVDLMSDWTQIDYTSLGNPQVYQVAIPDFAAGAMENWGLITFREVDLLDEGNKTSNSDKQRIITVMAHEISHQWFGDYVTLDWWSNTWLNEGFATYFQYHLANLVDNGTMELDKQFVTGVLQSVLQDDALPSSLPLSSPEKDINSPVEINNKFDDISYYKGGCIVRMMKYVLGESVFQKGLNSYLQKNKYRNTNPKMLLKSLQNATGGSIPNFKDKMQNWIYQPGYPILTVTQKDASTVSITQKRFYTDATTEWYVPLSYTNKKEKLFSVKIQGWLEPNKTYEIKHDKSDWIILNVMQSGFYKVNYDEQLWDNIIAALNGADSKSIHVLNKAQLIDDIFTIARTGEVGYDRAFRLIQFLKNETDYYPWVAGFGAFRYLVEKVDAQTEILLKSMILDLLNNAFPEETKFITHVDKLKEELLESWACKLGQEKCLNNAKTAFQEYKKTGRNPPTNKRETVFCYGLKASENIREDYNYLFSVFKNSTSSNEQNVILSSLGCIKNKDILMEYLELTIKENSTIRQQDFATVFSAVYSRSRLGLDVALSFLEKHFKKIETSYGGVNVLSSLVTGVASKLTTKEQGIVLNKIMKDHKESEQIKIIVNKVEELISGNERWKTLYGKQITKILQDLGGSSVRWYPNVVVLVISAVIVLINLF